MLIIGCLYFIFLLNYSVINQNTFISNLDRKKKISYIRLIDYDHHVNIHLYWIVPIIVILVFFPILCI